MSVVHKINRRDFLKASGLTGSALVLGVHAPLMARLFGEPDPEAEFEPNVFILVHEDGSVELTVPRSEMGQGARTACAMLLAEELDVDLEKVRVVQAVAHPRFGNQSTAGSTTVRTKWEPLRTAGAAAREMLVAAAAAIWEVPGSECRTENGRVLHASTERSLGYGALVADAAILPVPEAPEVKDPREFRIIGRSQTSLDAVGMIRGTATYGWDVDVPGLVFASLERSPTVMGRVKWVDDDAARAVDGVLDVVELDMYPRGGVDASMAVVADHSWAALKGRQSLAVEWEAGPVPPENSDEYRILLEETGSRPGRVVREEGDFGSALAEADRVLEARYHGPYLAHAPMEPPACTAWVRNGRCDVWAPTQMPQWARSEISGMLGIPESDVDLNVTLLGGAFGRKSKPDFVLEAVALSRKIGRPVKVIWTREDDIRHGFYRAQNYQLLKASLDTRGNPTGWFHRTVFPGIGWRFDPGPQGPGESELGQGFRNMPYRFSNVRLEVGSVPSSVRIGWMRSVCNTFHSFAVNSFMDELAHATGRDSVRFHEEMLGAPRILEFSEGDRENPYKFDTGRLSRVIEEVAKAAAWGRAVPERHGLGFAAQYSFMSYAAMVVHASVDEGGKLDLHEVHCAVDCGQVVNPDNVRAQMEGAVALGLSLALHGRITLREGIVEQGNFDDYPVLRMSEMPAVHTHIVESEAPPTGIGEPGVPPTAPALCNAIFAATGIRIRDLPILGKDLV